MTNVLPSELHVRSSGRSRADLLAEALHDKIRKSGAQPGASVGTLEDLRRESGFARATVSEAVRLLRERGVLDIRPGRGGGLYVAHSGPLVQLRHTLLEVGEDLTTVRDAIELRDHLEILIDTSAAEHRSDDDVDELRRLLHELEHAPGWNAFVQANWRLHEAIAGICPNAMARAVYVGTLGHLSTSSARHAEADTSSASYRADRVRVHADLVEAIAAGDQTRVRAAVSRHNTPHRTDDHHARG
jgi:GntR family transcriptional repressor for pyruvate dehydrogenase complex